MIKRDIKALAVEERVLLFCLGSGTDWKRAGITLETVGSMMMRFLVMALPNSGRLALTDDGRAALRALLRDL
jgi:hypothetical protein